MKLSEYSSPDFVVKDSGPVRVTFSLGETSTIVMAVYTLCRAKTAAPNAPLVLNLGPEVELEDFCLNGRPSAYTRIDNLIMVENVPDEIMVEVTTHLNPKDNTTGAGMYLAGDTLVTQCEAEDFSSITAFPDRPDVLAMYHVTLIGDKEKYPVMLSNGNLIESGDSSDGKHYTIWDNPFRMPCYLFAVVAGDVHPLCDTYTTMSGKTIQLAIYGEQRHVTNGSFQWAMTSLKQAMAFDEREYGRECDVDVYNICAIELFNAGAMENKGLNVFNEIYVLANPAITTDQAYEGVEGVIAHEYFHNWTGNRITCRDWLNLGLKEGLTVYRDQEFSRMRWGLRKIIQDVRLIRGLQFPEDAGPLAHPVRPSEINEANNMYTHTVYEKGAEVYRMLAAILGKEGFRQGTDLYFERHDGQAVDIDNLLQCMSDANDGVDLTQFKHWFNYAGTPEVTIESEYFPRTRRLEVSVIQICPATPGQPQKPPFYIPFKIGFVGPDGDMDMSACEAYDPATGLLHITKAVQQFVFEDVPAKQFLSLNRGFAPVKVIYQYGEGDLAYLMMRDSDAFARWDAGQTYASQVLLALVKDIQAGRELVLDQEFAEAFGRVLCEDEIDQNLLAAMMELPSESDLANQSTIVDPDAIHTAREFVKHALMVKYCHRFLLLYKVNQNMAEPVGETLHIYRGREQYKKSPQIDPVSVARRSVANTALAYLCTADKVGTVITDVYEQFEGSVGMTDKYAALKLLVHYQHLPAFVGPAQEALKLFYEQFKDDGTVVDTWLAVQAQSPRVSVGEIKALQQHPGYDENNPNRVKYLVRVFVNNPTAFHALSGDGYAFLAEFLGHYTEKNPQVAAQLVEPLCAWRRFDAKRQVMMKARLSSLRTALSHTPQTTTKGVMEKIEKALAQ